MNEMTAVPRHRQTPISIRSDKAARLLAQLTRDGRSQAQVIEDALECAVHDAAPPRTPSERRARIDAIAKPWHGVPGRSREEIEAEIYDDDGLPR
jgi:antitoxin VapB